MPDTVADTTPRDLLSVAQFSEKFAAFTQAALRSYILNAAPRVNCRGQKVAGNGLQECGAIFRVGRKLLLSESRVFMWIARQNGRKAAV